MNQRQIMNNVFLKVEIMNYLKTKKNPMSEDEYELYCKKNDVCMGIISEIKVSPYYFNKSGKKLMYQFLDLKTNTMRPIFNKKTGEMINKNIKKNQISWGL